MRKAGTNPSLKIAVVKRYTDIFKSLDAEFERDFNKYDSVSRLQRLIEQPSERVLREFVELIETELRVDYNIKSSFRESYQS